MGRIRLRSAEETREFGKACGQKWQKEGIFPLLALRGDLGAGKTTFVQGLALALGIEETIQSPTFVLLNAYEDRLYHFDLYRLKSAEDFLSLGFDEYFDKPGICVIEWPERIASLLPARTLFIDFFYEGKERIVSGL